MAKGGGGSRGGGGGSRGGGGGSAKRSAAGQRSSVESRFGKFAGNVAKQQSVLKDKNSTSDQRSAAKRKINLNVNNSKGIANFGMGGSNMATFQG